ncbi:MULTISPECIES: helix-turn-helix transcriptional regulator [unclassified Isoptericola]|uniref:helix-turn-helix transcriptional regulator n=1 Tax=unclassified Isoptericola TaxID=2623355 RepID=UPI00365A059D
MADPGVVGRSEVLAAVEHLLDAADRAPAALALSGPPGIGKTTVWLAALDRARERDVLVLAARPTAAEVQLEHAGLAEVLAPLSGTARRLPRAQRRALGAALGAERSGPDGGAQLVAAATRTLLQEAASRGPVLVAVDDLQWLDPSSRRALAFACRRVSGRVAVLTCARTEDGPAPGNHDPAPGDNGPAPGSAPDGAPDGRPETVVELEPSDPRRLVRLPLGPLPDADLLAVVRGVEGDAFAPLDAARLVASAGGSPLFALQLAEHRRSNGAPDGLPPTLRALVGARLADLAPATRDALLTAACLSDPHLDLLGEVHGGLTAVSAALAPAEDAGVVRLDDGHARFTHPLFAAGVLDGAPPSTRRARHRSLAEVVAGPEARARHLAHASTGPDPAAVAALDAAAAGARRRGATTVAVELEELALALGDRSPDRLVRAAADHLRVDSYGRALGLATEALTTEAPTTEVPATEVPATAAADVARARALGVVGQARFRLGDLAGSIAALEEAVPLAATDPGLRASLVGDLATGLLNAGQVERARERMIAGAPAAGPALPHSPGPPRGPADAELLAARVVFDQLSGRGLDEEAARLALDAEDPDRAVPAIRWPSVNVASALYFAGRPGAALPLLLAAERRCVERGQEADLWYVQFYAARAAVLVGELATAEGAVRRLEDRARGTDGPVLALMAATARAHLLAWTGDTAGAEPRARDAVAQFTAYDAPHVSALPASTLASVLLASADAAAVVTLLRPLERTVVAAGYRHPGFAGFVPDLVDALVATGDTAGASEVLDGYEAAGALPGGVWLQGVLARGRAAVAAATGDVTTARRLLDEALDDFAAPDLGYERGRTRLAQARIERRARRRAAAADAARRAVTELDAVGCALWAGVAAAERDRLTGPRAGSPLTAMETRVCELAATGRTNREVAAALSMSAKTVEAHLSRAYAKLAIRSRAELGARMARMAPPGGKGVA